jgi:hypothetical protein
VTADVQSAPEGRATATWTRDVLDWFTAGAGVTWAAVAVGSGRLSMYGEWASSRPVALPPQHTTHVLSHPSLVTEALLVVSVLVFLVWFPLTAAWLMLTAVGSFSHRGSARHRVYAAAVVVALLVFALTVALSHRAPTPDLIPLRHLVSSPRFDGFALRAVDGIGLLAVTFWFLRRRRA